MTTADPRASSPYKEEMVDLFAGPGGLDVAAEWLGIRARGVEWDANARETRNTAGLLTAFEGDVRNNNPSDFPNARILAGGPPCQTFTVAGSGAGRRALEHVLSLVHELDGLKRDKIKSRLESLDKLDDERTGLVLQPLRWVLEAPEKYDAIVLEQVPAVLPIWESMAQVMRRRGYHVTCGVLRTEEFGVPQTRRRAILMASPHFLPELPKPTHRRYQKDADQSVIVPGLSQWVSMEKALAPGRRAPFTVISNYGTGGDPKARGRREHYEPAFTVTGKISRNRLVGDAVQADVNDRFTHFEAGRLQTFPKDYPWDGNDRAQQVGNAIPPRLAAHVLAAVLGRQIDPKLLNKVMKAPWKNWQKAIGADSILMPQPTSISIADEEAIAAPMPAQAELLLQI